MNKKIFGAIALVAVLGGGLFLVANRTDSPATSAPSSSTSTPTEAVSNQSTEVDQQVEAEESGFTKEVNKYLSDNKITEPITSQDGLHSLYMYLHDARQIDPTLLIGETNEYFPGYLEWYNAEGWKVDIGPITDPAPAPSPVAPGEAGLQPDGSIKFEDGHVLAADRAKGEFVPIDQVLTHVQTHYGTEALATLSELVNKRPGFLEDIQSKLAKHPADEFKNKDIPYYEDVLGGIKQEEIDVYNAQNNYDPNKSVYNNG